MRKINVLGEREVAIITATAEFKDDPDFSVEQMDIYVSGWLAAKRNVAAAPAQGELSDALTQDVGYEGGTLTTDPTGLGAEVHLHFVSPAHAQIAFEWITDAIEQRIRGQVSDAADAARLDWLQEQPVDTLYMDDGKIVDVRGGDLRKAIDAAIQAQAGEGEKA